MSVGGPLEQERSFPEAAQFEDVSQDLRRSCGPGEEQRGYHSVETKDKCYEPNTRIA